MALGSTQPGAFPGVKGGRCGRLTTLPLFCAVVMKYGNLNFLESSGPLQSCNGTALPFYIYIWRLASNNSHIVKIVGKYFYPRYIKNINFLKYYAWIFSFSKETYISWDLRSFEILRCVEWHFFPTFWDNPAVTSSRTWSLGLIDPGMWDR